MADHDHIVTHWLSLMEPGPDGVNVVVGKDTFPLLGLNAFAMSVERQYSAAKKLLRPHVVSKAPRECTFLAPPEKVASACLASGSDELRRAVFEVLRRASPAVTAAVPPRVVAAPAAPAQDDEEVLPPAPESEPEAAVVVAPLYPALPKPRPVGVVGVVVDDAEPVSGFSARLAEIL